MDLVEIDGSLGEGGGQQLRTALSLSVLTGTPVEIDRIRAGRARPGLQPQHLAAVRAARELCDARTDGEELGSQRLHFAPGGPPRSGRHRTEIGTAGAVALVAQAVLPPLLHAEAASQVTITGGTHVPHAPPAEYLEAVYLPALARFGWTARARIEAAGFFPRGGGELWLDTVPGGAAVPVTLAERGPLQRLRAFVVTSGLPNHVGERGAESVRQFLKAVGREAEVEVRRLPSAGPGAAVVLAVACEGGHAGFTSLGQRGKPMERVANGACEQFMRWWKSGAAVDEYLADQLVLPAALARGESRWTAPAVTGHLRSVLEIVARFLPVEATLTEASAVPAEIRLRSAGLPTRVAPGTAEEPPPPGGNRGAN